MVLIVLVSVWTALCRKGEDEQVSIKLKRLLHRGEVLKDYRNENHTVYALVGTKGNKKHKDLLVVFAQNAEGELKRSYENDFTGLTPRKIETADIDGDGEKELLITVYKATHYDTIRKNRLFVFQYHKVLEKKWTGSEIAGTWNTFYTGDLTDRKGDELIFVQRAAGGKERLAIYYWFDFGFVLLAKSREYPKIIDVKVTQEKKLEITYKDGIMPKIHTLVIRDGKVIQAKN
jgi:hypothetical protein